MVDRAGRGQDIYPTVSIGTSSLRESQLQLSSPGDWSLVIPFFVEVGVVMRYLGQFPSELTPQGWPGQWAVHQRRCAKLWGVIPQIPSKLSKLLVTWQFRHPKPPKKCAGFLFDRLSISPAPNLGQMGPRMTLRSDLKETIIPELLEEDPSSLSREALIVAGS